MRRCLIVLLVICSCAVSDSAQTTHAEATSQKWKGIDVSTVLGNSTYTECTTTPYVENGKPIILFNIGTGRFIIEGGSWGVEGRLLYSQPM